MYSISLTAKAMAPVTGSLGQMIVHFQHASKPAAWGSLRLSGNSSQLNEILLLAATISGNMTRGQVPGAGKGTDLSIVVGIGLDGQP
jgi:hypothetical protein